MPPAIDADPGVLLRIAARDRGWPAHLPPVPAGNRLTVTVGHPRLLPVDSEATAAAGYVVVGVAAAHRPIGATIDVLVPGVFLTGHPEWMEAVRPLAERVFDLRMGPVQRVLAAELAVHRRSLGSG